MTVDYKTARQKSEEAQFTSDLESQDTDAERHRSRERRKRQYDSDESSDKSPQQRKKRKTNKASEVQTPQACLFTPPPPPSQTILIAKQNSITPLVLQHQQSATALPIPSPPRESAFVTLEPSRPSTSTVHNGTDTPSDYRPLTEEAGSYMQ